MKQIEDIKVINVGDKAIAVDTLSDRIKELVDVYNEFRRDELTANLEHIKVKAALANIQQQIILAIKEEQEAAEDTNAGE